jgi:hypothetical protein
MFVLTGKLRRKALVKTKEGKELCKLTLEHEVSRETGPGDLRLDDLFCAPSDATDLEEGQNAAFSVRVYPKGREVGIALVKVLSDPSQGVWEALNATESMA